MANMFAVGESWLRTQRRNNVPVEVVYVRAGVQPINCIAAKGETVERADDQVAQLFGRFTDWLIDVAELSIAIPGHGIQRMGPPDHGIRRLGPPATMQEIFPAAGDRIEVGGRRYSVSSADGNERPWRFHGRDNLTYRIHTIEIP